MGIIDNEGLIEGCLLGRDDSCDVGQSEIGGLVEGWLLGTVLMDGDSEGIDDGQSVTDGASLGWLLGLVESCAEGCSLGIKLG